MSKKLSKINFAHFDEAKKNMDLELLQQHQILRELAARQVEINNRIAYDVMKKSDLNDQRDDLDPGDLLAELKVNLISTLELKKESKKPIDQRKKRKILAVRITREALHLRENRKKMEPEEIAELFGFLMSRKSREEYLGNYLADLKLDRAERISRSRRKGEEKWIDFCFQFRLYKAIAFACICSLADFTKRLIPIARWFLG